MSNNFLTKCIAGSVARLHQSSLKTIATVALLTLSLQNLHAASSVSQWNGAIVYAGSSKVSSGVPVSKCHVLTNEHAIRHWQKVSVAIARHKYIARVIAIDKHHDLALLKLDTCPIRNYAKVSSTQPVRGEKLTSVYYRFGLIFSKKMIKSTGSFLGYLDVTTEEDKKMLSMVIDDKQPRKGASGGGVFTRNGLVSVIFGVTDGNMPHKTFAVDYFSLTQFLKKNNIYQE